VTIIKRNNLGYYNIVNNILISIKYIIYILLKKKKKKKNNKKIKKKKKKKRECLINKNFLYKKNLYIY